MTRRNLYYNYIGYPNYYAPGGNLNFQEILEEENAAEYAKQVANQKENKFLDAMNNNGGGWASAIAPAATNIANAFTDTETSTAERVAGAMGIPVLAKQWTADTTKGNQYLKGLALQNTGIKKPNYIQDASSAWGANNAIKLNAQNNISPISSESALPSLKDFKGNWWRNTGAAVAQGAAAGSVGGPWGALGGAVTGLFGSIGGLFGRQKRANAAYKDFLSRRDTLMSARQAQFNKANIDQTLSNMQALANGNLQQRINDMANIRAYGGNLYPIGGTIKEGYEEVAQEPVYEGGELPEITVRAESMPWYEKVWRKGNRFVNNNIISPTLGRAQYAWNYLNSKLADDDDSSYFLDLSNKDVKRVQENNQYNVDAILANDFVETDNPNSLRKKVDFANTSDTLIGDMNIPLRYISTYYGVEDGKLKAGTLDSFKDNTLIVPNRASNIGKIKEWHPSSLIDETYKHNPIARWGAEKLGDLLSSSFVDDYVTNKVMESLSDDDINSLKELLLENDGIENPTQEDLKTAAILYTDLIDSNTLQQKISDYRTRLYDYADEKNPARVIRGFAINENNDTIPDYKFNTYPKGIFADENGNAVFFSGLTEENDRLINEYLKKHPSYPVMLDNGRFGHYTTNNDLNVYSGGMIDPNETMVIGINNNTKAMGGNLYTDLSPNMMSLWNNKQQIDQQKVNMQQMNFGLGNSFNQKLNTFDFGGSMNGMDLPTNMQSYENGGTHEENPYGGIQVGVDQQGNPNLVEEGEFRWGDYIFSDRINVDPTLLSRYNLAPATKHQGKKANKGKLSYADMAKKYAKKNKELANDPIGKNTLEAYMKRLQDAQEDQKFQDSMEQQKQDAIRGYQKALSTPQQGNPMYGAMKYNGMGNAATQQGVNAGMSDLGQQGGGNEVLSNTNRSGNNMLHAFGGNLYAFGGDDGFPEDLLSEAYKRYRESQYPTIKNNEVTLKAKSQDFTPWVSEPDTYPVDYEYFFDNNSPTKFTGMSPTGVQPYIHPAASPIDTYQYTPYKSRIGSNLPVYAPHSNYVYESNGSRIPFYLRYEPQYFKHSNRIEDNYIPIEQPWEDNVVIPDRGIQGNRNWQYDNYLGNTVYKSNFNSKIDTRPSYIIEKNPNSIAPAVSTYTWNGYDGLHLPTPESLSKFEQDTGAKLSKRTLYPNGLKALNNNEYLSQLERSNPTNLILSTGTGWGIPQNSTNPLVGSANTNVEPDAFALQAQGKTANGSTANADYTTGYNGTADTNTGRSNLTDGIKRDTTTTFDTAAIKEDPKQVPHYSTAGEYAMFGKDFTPMLYDWMNKTNTKYDPNQRPAYELADIGNNSTFLRTADTIGGYRAPNLMDAERMNNAAQAQGIAASQAALNVGNGNRGFAAAQTAQNAYNTQMGIGNNYATAQQANNEERYKTDAYNTAIDQFNANARNSMYQYNQKAQQVGQQMKIDAKKYANDYILRNELYADTINRQAMENRAANQATWTDNALNYFIAQAQKNDILNAKNNDITNPYWTDKNGVMHYIGDSGLNSAIYDAFTDGSKEWGDYAVNNGTFSGDRLKAWNALQEKYSAADLKAHPELWKSLVLQEKQARKEEAEKAELAKTDRLNNQRYAFDNNMAQLNNYRTLYGDKFTDSQWYDDLMKRYNDAANAKEFNDVNNLEYWNRVIGDKLNYWQRYNTPVTANQSAYGGYINNNNKSNKREYYNYMRR